MDRPSKIRALPETRDLPSKINVFFTKNGSFYFVSTLPKDEAWLTEILQTWEFTD